MQDNHKSLIDVHVRRKISFDDLAHNGNAQVSHVIMMMDKKREEKIMFSTYKEQAQFALYCNWTMEAEAQIPI